jgi:hypothetical protein
MEAFSQSVDPIYQRVRDAGDDQTVATAIADDLFVQTTIANVDNILKTMMDACKEEGIELTLSKCVLFDPYGDDVPTPAAAVSLAAKYGIQMKKGSMVQLGAAIGLDNQKRSVYVREKINEIVVATLNIISSPSFPAQAAPMYLRQVVKSKAVYLGSTHSPEITREPLQLLGQQIRRALLTKIQAPVDVCKDQRVHYQLKMNVTQGGFGLRPPNVENLFMTSTERAIASFPDNIPMSSDAVDDDEDEHGVGFAKTPTMQSAVNCAIMLENEVGALLKSQLPTVVGANGMLIPTGANLKVRNKEITAALGQVDKETIASKPQLQELARRLEDLCDVNARRIFTATPSAFNLDTALNNRVFCNIVLHALGVHIKPDAPTHCCTCKQLYTPAHPHCCITERRKAVTTRHDCLVYALVYIIRQAGLAAVMEPKPNIASGEPNLKPDVLVTSADGKSFTIDTSVVHTTAPSYVKTNVKSQLQNRANAKTSKYKAREESLGRDFVPFVLSSLGTFHSSAIQLLDKIAEHARLRNLTWCKHAFRKQAIRRLLYTLHLGNSAVLEYSWNVQMNAIQPLVE